MAESAQQATQETEVLALIRLAEHTGYTHDELAVETGGAPSSMRRLTQALRRKGLIVETEGRFERRVIFVAKEFAPQRRQVGVTRVEV